MQWSQEAEDAIRKVPFFVRKRVRKRVETEARERGHSLVTLTDVEDTRRRYLHTMAAEVSGYQLETCFGAGGCPHRTVSSDALVQKMEAVLQEADLLGFLKNTVRGGLRFHHEFRITLADCPNACSQPQIRDIGIIAAAEPVVADPACTRCEACREACREKAISLPETGDKPDIEMARCVRCGQCMSVCPTGTLQTGKTGYRVALGGKLGRHPRLARELPCLLGETDVVRILHDCLDLYKSQSTSGQRFAEIFTNADFEKLRDAYCGS